MRILYSCFFYLALPLVLLRLCWRSIREPRYRETPMQRLGFHRPTHAGDLVWIHAVSAGETVAAAPLVERLVAQGRKCLVTNMTPTGRERCEALLGHLGDAVEHGYAPYDLPGAMRRFLNRVRPRELIIIDTELWPNMLHQAARAGVKTALVNGRLSAKSANGYARFGSTTARMLGNLDIVAVQTAQHGERFQKLGALAERIHVTGSIKFDATLPTSLGDGVSEARERTGGRPVLVGASTHPGEEEALLQSLPTATPQIPDLLLVLAPRHTRRADQVAELCTRHGKTLLTHSSGQNVTDQQVFMLDVMGQLPAYMELANVCFVGGSLAPVGGHNLLEAVRAKSAVIMGPHLRNIEDIAAQFQEANAMTVVQSPQQLAQEVARLLGDDAARTAMIDAASTLLEQNQGALDRVMALL